MITYVASSRKLVIANLGDMRDSVTRIYPGRADLSNNADNFKENSSINFIKTSLLIGVSYRYSRRYWVVSVSFKTL